MGNPPGPQEHPLLWQVQKTNWYVIGTYVYRRDAELLPFFLQIRPALFLQAYRQWNWLNRPRIKLQQRRFIRKKIESFRWPWLWLLRTTG